MLLNLTDALACVFLNAFGYDEFLKEESSLQTQLAPVAEIKSAAPATESKPENETPAPVSEDTEETEPEATAMAAVGGGEPAVMRDPDPDNVARTQAELGSETKKTSTRRHGSKTGGPKKGK
jgi:hypothetical protein